ncbi:hypothetical protein CTAM01_08228 [Colletotrichum tamarilloi]|uniref:NmrA-like domain-containing protein n=1 Tax=Colletotrichum tamarilloi TaxID=1209934 RepID=A0ABQ9R6M9_9PEZI|nr:uncharacterized protein CTAM01_08228 [Colletotrichum tamarilloi]KAK1496590.1 hypothetical protein CTAM01_08228 [Colletotrichum tamarilloi]
MLVLIAGISGSLGSRLAMVAKERGVSVRGLGRDPSKLSPELAQSLESFVTSRNYYDIPALDKAVAGVDAIICAYNPTPLLDLDGCLLLLRAAERANVKVFMASLWNNDWTKIKFGDFEHYDAHIAFEQQAAMTSSIKPVYLLTGTFADLLFTPYGPGGFDTSGDVPQMRYWGEGNKKLHSWTAQDDVAAWTIEILINGDGVQQGKGGFFRMRSGVNTIEELALAYEEATGTFVEVKRQGTLGMLAEEIARLRKEKGRARNFEYLPEVVAFLSDQGLFEVPASGIVSLGHVRKPTTLEEHLKIRFGS